MPQAQKGIRALSGTRGDSNATSLCCTGSCCTPPTQRMGWDKKTGLSICPKVSQRDQKRPDRGSFQPPSINVKKPLYPTPDICHGEQDSPAAARAAARAPAVPPAAAAARAAAAPDAAAVTRAALVGRAAEALEGWGRRAQRRAWAVGSEAHVLLG
eukprot:scaffold185727_cov17-Tisochrysis_lutea.AAC.1